MPKTAIQTRFVSNMRVDPDLTGLSQSAGFGWFYC